MRLSKMLNDLNQCKILKDVINLEGQLTDEVVVATGDYVYKDEEGYFYFSSRHDDMIKNTWL